MERGPATGAPGTARWRGVFLAVRSSEVEALSFLAFAEARGFLVGVSSASLSTALAPRFLGVADAPAVDSFAVSLVVLPLAAEPRFFGVVTAFLAVFGVIGVGTVIFASYNGSQLLGFKEV